jgi:hypothetical protein
MKKSLAVITTCKVGFVRIDVTPHLPRDAGSCAIILRSGLRHFSACADLDIFDKRAEQGSVDPASENRRLNPRPTIVATTPIGIGGCRNSREWCLAAFAARVLCRRPVWRDVL